MSSVFSPPTCDPSNTTWPASANSYGAGLDLATTHPWGSVLQNELCGIPGRAARSGQPGNMCCRPQSPQPAPGNESATEPATWILVSVPPARHLPGGGGAPHVPSYSVLRQPRQRELEMLRPALGDKGTRNKTPRPARRNISKVSARPWSTASISDPRTWVRAGAVIYQARQRRATATSPEGAGVHAPPRGARHHLGGFPRTLRAAKLHKLALVEVQQPPTEYAWYKQYSGVSET